VWWEERGIKSTQLKNFQKGEKRTAYAPQHAHGARAAHQSGRSSRNLQQRAVISAGPSVVVVGTTNSPLLLLAQGNMPPNRHHRTGLR
jgi:hypothetical protein